MDRRLIEGAKKGDVEKLHRLINDDPFLLQAASLASVDTPSHVASMGGHFNIVKEVLNLSSKFANELNQNGFSPLHIASASGDVEIVKELLKVGNHPCLVKGKETRIPLQRIPLHYAVAKGRIQVITELLSACQDSITEVTARGETCFHLAAKNNQFEAFKILCDHVVTLGKEDILNKKDEQGNTILYLAASRKQYEVFDLLLDKNTGCFVKLEVNSLNKKGLTPFDVLVAEGGECEIEETFTLAGATTGAVSPQNSVVTTHNRSRQDQRRSCPKFTLKEFIYPDYFTLKDLVDLFNPEKTKDFPSEARETMLVIATLIETATYSAMLSLPGGLRQDDCLPDDKSNTSTKQPPQHIARKTVFATRYSAPYCLFMVFNSLGFSMSMQIIRVLIIGLPLEVEHRILVAVLVTYFACVGTISPDVAKF